MITVWHMNGVMNAGGTESLLMNILAFCGGSIRHVLVIHSQSRDEVGMYDAQIRALGVRMLWLPSVGSVGVKEYKRQFCKLVLAEGKPDVIHSHVNAVGGIMVKVAKEMGIPHRIVHCHADIRYSGSVVSVLKAEVRLAIMKMYVNRYATDYFACSDRAACRLFYRPDKAVIIRNAIDVRKYACDAQKKQAQRQKLGVDAETLVIGAVGRIARIKNYEVILKAVRVLANQGHKIRFICYGRIADESYDAELRQMVADLGIGEQVVFAGNSTSISDDIAAFDVFVMPSATEGLGIAALEAQAAGKKTLLSTGVPREADLELGLVTYLNPYDHEQWARCIPEKDQPNPDSLQIEEAFKAHGYSAVDEVQKIESVYEKIVRG